MQLQIALISGYETIYAIYNIVPCFVNSILLWIDPPVMNHLQSIKKM